MENAKNTKGIETRVQAVYKGQTIGWYDNADDAQAALDAYIAGAAEEPKAPWER